MRACWLTCIFVSLSASSVFGAVDEPVPVMQASAVSATEQQVCEVMSVLAEVGRLCVSCRINSETSLAVEIRATAEKIRPYCDRLRQIPADKLRKLCILADAVMWQKEWVYRTYLGEHGVRMKPSHEIGFEVLVYLMKIVPQRLASDSVSDEEKSAWKELINCILGDETIFPTPERLMSWRKGKDYKTALNFFKDMASALSTEDEALSLKLLQEQSEVLDYLLQDGEYERIRVAHLLSAFIEARVKICTRAGLHHPALPPHLRTEARLNVLQTFYSRLPQLKNLCEL